MSVACTTNCAVSLPVLVQAYEGWRAGIASVSGRQRSSFLDSGFANGPIQDIACLFCPQLPDELFPDGFDHLRLRSAFFENGHLFVFIRIH